MAHPGSEKHLRKTRHAGPPPKNEGESNTAWAKRLDKWYDDHVRPGRDNPTPGTKAKTTKPKTTPAPAPTTVHPETAKKRAAALKRAQESDPHRRRGR